MAKPRALASPAARLDVSECVWEKGKAFHRVHRDEYEADQFNESGKGNARFSPISDAEGKVIPTLYGGGSYACALMEVPFHDVPFESGFKTFDKGKLDGLVHSVVEPAKDLRLADLTNKPLRKLGIPRRDLIDSDKDQYPMTREWAKAIHAQCPDLQGLCWTSRQDDTQPALMLFGDRIKPGSLMQIGDSRSLVDNADAYDELLDVADLIGLGLVPGKS